MWRKRRRRREPYENWRSASIASSFPSLFSFSFLFLRSSIPTSSWTTSTTGSFSRFPFFLVIPPFSPCPFPPPRPPPRYRRPSFLLLPPRIHHLRLLLPQFLYLIIALQFFFSYRLPPFSFHRHLLLLSPASLGCHLPLSSLSSPVDRCEECQRTELALCAQPH